MAVREILLLGNPLLRERCRRVRSADTSSVQSIINDLRDTLQHFRSQRGFGRGIAAPQIGVAARVIYVDYEFSGAMLNPRITKRSRKKFLLWDDCFSFPELLVRVERSTKVDVEFEDEAGKKKHISASGGFAELLQHEIDHLDGILAIDRAVDSRHIILRSEYEKLQSDRPRSL
jgi:peptide deformylase